MKKIIEEFSSGKFDHAEIIFNSFKNAANQIISNRTALQ